MYFDYCKAYLWPTFHYLGLSDHQSKEKQDKAWSAYYAANLAYANKVAEVYREGDLVSHYLTLQYLPCLTLITLLLDLGARLPFITSTTNAESKVP